LNLTNPEDVTAIIQASNNKRRQISTARENVKRMKTNTYAEEEKILDSQKDVDDINTKIFTSWGQMLMNINSNLSNMEKNINDIKKDQSDIKKDQIDIKNDVKGIKKEQTEMNKKMDGMKKKLDGMEKEQTEMKKEQTEMSKKMDGMEKGFASIKSDVRWLLNKTQYKEGSTFLEMPFTVGEDITQ
jgi:chromosome segregation ATPase